MNRRQEGFTIIEVIVALVLLAVVLTSLAGLSVAASRAAVANADAARRQALALELANRYVTAPWAAVHGVNWCDVVGETNNSYQRCVSSLSNGVVDTIIVVVTPQQRQQVPETIRLVRSKP